MLKARLLTAAVILPLLLAGLFYLPSIAWALLLLVILFLAAFEWARLIQLTRLRKIIFLVGLGAITIKLLLVPNVIEGHGWPNSILLITCGSALIFWIVIAPLWLFFRWQRRIQLPLTIVGWLVLTATWLALVQLQSESAWLALLFLSVIWVADTAAYFAGRRFGRYKLAPEISPGKTWEGVVGALIAVTLYTIILMLSIVGFDSIYAELALKWFLAMYILLILSIIGDLFESLLKRLRGVKDSGELLPGHGGVLDRIDSLTAALPAAALIAHYL